MIALDANGADNGPDVVARGAELSGLDVKIFGPPMPGIGNDEEPALAVRSKQDASIVQAARAVGDGSADALVSPGPTGATLAAAVLYVKRIRGVHRPAVAALVPVPGGKPTLMLDVGANVEVRPEHLVQFAYMGATFMEAVVGVPRPRVGLLSVGEEAKKGTPDVVEANERLAAGPLDFAGNIEGNDVLSGVVDVVVTAIRDAIRSSPISSIGGLLIRGRVGKLREQIDPNTTGGAILLGIRHPVVVAHGKSSAEGIANAVRLARRAADEDMVGRTASALAEGGALRSAPAASFART